MNNKYIAGLLGLGIVIAIICITGIARKSLSIFKQTSIPLILHSSIFDEAVTDISYLKYLQNHIRASGVRLGTDIEKKRDDLIRELMIVTKLEDKKDIQQMSIDAREISVGIIKDIYRLYGINIIFDTDKEGYRVEDKAGNIIYHSSPRVIKADLNLFNGVIVACFALVFVGLSIFMTVKNKICIKDGDFDGLNEKEYA
jgi:hypothetical protein